ncbi:S-formylglutathione hydrolase [Strongylocentrotus purpuratus]|uniref:S-formylglutathione hydrolase n=1 Tax=Strongylocentrotus purpuratus TaxID=7668 RepID=A0A7M7G477_STRPU|nr:S-formylglutathione hydrolase [Strongylocentrotus purpuratus]
MLISRITIFVKGITKSTQIKNWFEHSHIFQGYRTRKMSGLTEVSCNKSFGGLQKVFSHDSSECKCKMTFSVYLPSQSESGPCPTLIYLSGLTCTDQNVTNKGGFQRVAAQYGMVVVCPDTSPRGCSIEGEDESYDFGSGAGFYLDATEEKWKTNYRMSSYVTKELFDLIVNSFPVNPDKVAITGHSMGGHGALTLGLKNPHLFKSISAFAPICNPISCPWGQKAFKGYLGPDENTWKEYDACELVSCYDGPPREILIDQGKGDNFYNQKQLLPENFVTSCQVSRTGCIMNLREGYDHSYYFISTFMEDHIKFHSQHL